jgi:hypothetical protein
MSPALRKGDLLDESAPSATRAAVGTKQLSLNEFAEQFEKAIHDKQALSTRLGQALDEIASMSRYFQEERTRFEAERNNLNLEIESLRAQLSESSRKDHRKIEQDAGIQSVLAARERLIRDEFERKFQELTIDVRRLRKKHSDEVQRLKDQLSNCICRGAGLR